MNTSRAGELPREIVLDSYRLKLLTCHNVRVPGKPISMHLPQQHARDLREVGQSLQREIKNHKENSLSLIVPETLLRTRRFVTFFRMCLSSLRRSIPSSSTPFVLGDLIIQHDVAVKAHNDTVYRSPLFSLTKERYSPFAPCVVEVESERE